MNAAELVDRHDLARRLTDDGWCPDGRAWLFSLPIPNHQRQAVADSMAGVLEHVHLPSGAVS